MAPDVVDRVERVVHEQLPVGCEASGVSISSTDRDEQRLIKCQWAHSGVDREGRWLTTPYYPRPERIVEFRLSRPDRQSMYGSLSRFAAHSSVV